MKIRLLALAGVASLALTLPPALAQDATPPAAPGAETAAPATTTAPDAGKAATPVKHHRKKHRMKASSSSENQTTAQLNQQQMQNPGSTAKPSTTAPAEGMANEPDAMDSKDQSTTMHHKPMKKHKQEMDDKAETMKSDVKGDMMKSDSPATPQPTTPTP